MVIKMTLKRAMQNATGLADEAAKLRVPIGRTQTADRAETRFLPLLPARGESFHFSRSVSVPAAPAASSANAGPGSAGAVVFPDAARDSFMAEKEEEIFSRDFEE